MKYKIGDVVKLKSKEELIKLGNWYEQCADECGGRSYKITELVENSYRSDNVTFDEESVACLVSEAELSEEEDTYTLDELKKRVDEFRNYILDFSTHNKCAVGIEITTKDFYSFKDIRYKAESNIRILD